MAANKKQHQQPEYPRQRLVPIPEYSRQRLVPILEYSRQRLVPIPEYPEDPSGGDARDGSISNVDTRGVPNGFYTAFYTHNMMTEERLTVCHFF